MDHMLLGDQIQILHEALALMVLWLPWHLQLDTTTLSNKLFWHPTHFLYVFRLLNILHGLSLLRLLALNLWLLVQKCLALLLVLEILVLDI